MPSASCKERTVRATLCLLLGVSSWSAAAAVSSDEVGQRPLPFEAPTDRDYYDDGAPPAAKVELGRLLFFDKILSGNRNVSCATCHHPNLGTGDSVALSLGEGASGRGRERTSSSAALYRRLPRNSPALFNVGAREFRSLFHDGRVELLAHGARLRSPAKQELPPGLDSVLAAQALFPVSSADEMAGHPGENEVAEALGQVGGSGHRRAWQVLTGRLRSIPAYVELFRRAYPRRVRNAGDVTYVDAANAIAAFEGVAFRSDSSPFDRFLRGESDLPTAARRGMELFYGKAGCDSCHGGPFQTDHDFHAIAMPQIGPGKGDGHDLGYWQATGQRAFVEDFGRGRVTGRDADRYRFRTPSLRNVALTGPWGHDGAYDSLEAVVRHHLDPEKSVEAYRASQVALPRVGTLLDERAGRATAMSTDRRQDFLARDGWVQRSPELRRALVEANELQPLELSDSEIADLLEFLHALTDPGVEEMSRWVPDAVPSRLPVVD